MMSSAACLKSAPIRMFAQPNSLPSQSIAAWALVVPKSTPAVIVLHVFQSMLPDVQLLSGHFEYSFVMFYASRAFLAIQCCVLDIFIIVATVMSLEYA